MWGYTVFPLYIGEHFVWGYTVFPLYIRKHFVLRYTVFPFYIREVADVFHITQAQFFLLIIRGKLVIGVHSFFP